PTAPPFPYTTLFRSSNANVQSPGRIPAENGPLDAQTVDRLTVLARSSAWGAPYPMAGGGHSSTATPDADFERSVEEALASLPREDRKSTRLNSSHQI